MVDNIAWLEAKIAQASNEGNYTDWQNYTDMLKTEQSRASPNDGDAECMS